MSASKLPSKLATSPSIAEMRIASIKAGLISAAALTVAAGCGWGLAILLQSSYANSLPFFGFLPASLFEWLVDLAVALACGFFFGITYRYIVRRDDNLHLGSGAVGAFAFVRSLAQIEASWNDTFAPLFWLLVTGESFLWFAAARYTLDWAIRREIIEPLD